jgi:hypothetical protein
VLCNESFVAKKVLLIDIGSVFVSKELVHKRSETAKRLNDRVHVARVSQVLESSVASFNRSMDGHKKLKIVDLLDALSRWFDSPVDFSP